DVWKAPKPIAAALAFDEVARVGGEGAKLRGAGNMIELLRADLFGLNRVGGQNLLGEIERQARGLSEIALLNTLGEPGFEFGKIGVELAKGLFVDLEQAA